MATEGIKDNLYFTFLQTSQNNPIIAQRVTFWKKCGGRGTEGSWYCRLSLFMV